MGVCDLQPVEAAHGIDHGEAQPRRTLLLRTLVEAVEDMPGVERTARAAVRNREPAGRHRDDDLPAGVAVDERILHEVSHHAPGQRGVHAHRQRPFVGQREAHVAVGVDLLHILGRAAHQRIHIDRLGFGKLPVVDLRQQQ